MKGDLTNVELRTVRINTDLENHSTLKIFEDALNKLPEDEQILLWCHFDWNMSAQRQQLGETGDRAWIRKLSRFTIEYFDKFIDCLHESYYSGFGLKFGFDYLKSLKIVLVEGYMVRRTFARVLVLLRRKHGDISSNSES